MVGLVTRRREHLGDDRFDVVFYEVKDVTGRRVDPEASAVNMVSCHGDSARADDPAYVAVDDEGRPATRDRPYFDWGYVCPTHPEYREGLLELVDRCVAVAPDVRLDDVGFPRQEYCHCERCDRHFAESGFADRRAWRADVVSAVVTDARERVPGRLYLTLYPDPMPGHLRARSGLDLERLEALVDTFVVPIYDLAYTTTYWLEVLASGFADRLRSPFIVELYGPEVDPDRLRHAMAVADAYATGVAVAYDDDRAVEAVEAGWLE
ncbi:MAG: hypothetical protein ACLFMX_00645 [Halobacteriales archaeon]